MTLTIEVPEDLAPRLAALRLISQRTPTREPALASDQRRRPPKLRCAPGDGLLCPSAPPPTTLTTPRHSLNKQRLR